VEAGSSFLFDYLYAVRRQVAVPQIVQTLGRGVVYAALLLVLLSHVAAAHDIAGLVTGSAMVSIILGLAMQETLGNLFAGIAMQLTKPYTIGHWILIGNNEGRVEKADWRSVTIRTTRGDHVSFPHSVLAKMEIHNYSLPTPLHAREICVGVHYRHPPDHVKEVMARCAAIAPSVVNPPAPVVRVTDFQDSAILYTLKFWITDFEHWRDIESDVRRNIWYQFNRAELQIPFPIRDVYHHPERKTADPAAENLALLRGLVLFKTLSEEQSGQLAARLKTEYFARGETICRQGDTDTTFYVIKTGQVEVAARTATGQVAFTGQLSAGEFFGEFSLMTGEPRSATVTAAEPTEVLTIGKNDMRRALEASPELGESISRMLAARREQLREHLNKSAAEIASAARMENMDSLSRELLRKIRDFFSY
jgi:small-conductance mechanosensitive channel